MAIQRLNFGTAAPNDGEFGRTAFPKLDSNDAYLEGLISAHETRIDDLETDVTAGVPSGTSGYALIGNGVGNATTFQGFTQAGTGAVTRTWQEKMRESVSVLDYIPTAYHANILAGTSTDDVTTYVQAAIDYLLTLGGGTLYFPNGTYYLPSSTSLDPDTGNIAFVGASKEATVLKINEGTSGSKRYTFKNTVNVAKGSLVFRNLQLQGTLATTAQRAGNPLYLDHYSSVVLDGCRWYNIGGEAMDLHYCGRFAAINCEIEAIAADGIRVRDTPNCIIIGNDIRRTGDDPIAIHTGDIALVSGPIRSRVVISENTLLNCAGSIKALGLKNASINNNVIQLCQPAGIVMGIGLSVDEGQTPMHSISVCGNTITDIIQVTSATPGTPSTYITIRVLQPTGSAATHSARPYQYDSTDATIIRAWNWSDADGDDAADAVPPLDGVRISGNITGRTLPSVSAVSDWGYGAVISQGNTYDPAIVDSNLEPSAAIAFTQAPGVINTDICDNTLRHATTAIQFVTPTTEYDYINVRFARNNISDCRSYGLTCTGSSLHLGITVEDNNFDLDPYRRAINSNLDGTYDANGAPIAVDLGPHNGAIIRRNTFRNCCQTIASNAINGLLVEDNVSFCGTPVATGFNASNKGIGNILTGYGRIRYIIVDADPTSANWNQVSSQMLKISSSMPSAGWYYAGWIVWDTTAGATRLGWYRLTTGTGHVLNTDWAEIGTVKGPTSATDNALARFDATTGRLLQNSGVIVDDSNNVTGANSVTVTDDAYAAGWNASTAVPTKNAVYDKIELVLGTTLPATYQPLDSDLTSWAAVTRAAGFDTFAATPSSANLRSLLSDESGSGAAYFQGGALGTPASGNLSNCTDLSASAVGTAINAGTPITDLADTDRFGVLDASSSNALVPVTWATIKSELAAEGAIREILTAARTYYVRTDGSDSNNGLANTSGGAFLTLQKAVDVVCGSIDTAGYAVTVSVADGTYTGAATFTTGWAGAGTVTFQGNTTTPANVVCSASSLISCSANLPAAFTVKGFKHTGSGQTIIHTGVGRIQVQDMDFAGTGFAHIQASGPGSSIWIYGNYSITAAATYHYYASSGGAIIRYAGVSPTVTLTGTLAFTTFTLAQYLSVQVLNGMTYDVSGATVTGKRYDASLNSVIGTAGGGASYFPGNAAGSTATGGQYA